MSPLRCEQNLLLVEGIEELFLIPELIEQAGKIAWRDRGKQQHPVEIKCCKGVYELLDRDRIDNFLKLPNLARIGIVIDADDDLAARWQQVHSRFIAVCPTLPATVPPEGVDLPTVTGLRLGIWIMPDNQTTGMLENLLEQLIPTSDAAVFTHAQTATAQAKSLGARFKTTHLAKAQLHSWLAWQDPPGRQLHEAVKHRVLDSTSPWALPFVEWFITLFELDDLRGTYTP